MTCMYEHTLQASYEVCQSLLYAHSWIQQYYTHREFWVSGLPTACPQRGLRGSMAGHGSEAWVMSLDFFRGMYSTWIFLQINHFPGTFQIGRKDRLWRNLYRLQARVGKKNCDFVPHTYVLPPDLPLLKRVWEEGGKQKWILKPVSVFQYVCACSVLCDCLLHVF